MNAGRFMPSQFDTADALDAILAEAAAASLAAQRTRADDADALKVVVKFTDATHPSGIQWRPAVLLGHYDDSRARVLVLDTRRRFTANVPAGSIRLPDGNPIPATQLAQLTPPRPHAAHAFNA